ncbi:hypothetical protein DPMN_063484 [Dreissena polymorpha]|uniref:Uncharacterized protein n=1 Tax=Dreissena polymorpha TaxID=45954 RepID=A0A9D4CBT8_DREPO|nr:hypothetical protein DPMN_063484 [Dreissena polymorpha]
MSSLKLAAAIVPRLDNCPPPPPGSHFHDDWAKNVTSRETNVLTKFHENWAKNVTFRVEKCPARWWPCISPIWTIFELVQDINTTNVLSNFHDDWAKIVTSSVFTRKTAPPTGGHVFQWSRTTFELNQHIIKTNILTNFQLHRDIIGTNLLTKFHEDRTKNVASRVFTRKTAPPTGGHIGHEIFELDRDIIGTKLLTKFHEDRKRNPFYYINIRETAHPPGNHVFQRTGTIFELNSHIKETNVLTKFMKIGPKM